MEQSSLVCLFVLERQGVLTYTKDLSRSLSIKTKTYIHWSIRGLCSLQTTVRWVHQTKPHAVQTGKQSWLTSCLLWQGRTRDGQAPDGAHWRLFESKPYLWDRCSQNLHKIFEQCVCITRYAALLRVLFRSKDNDRVRTFLGWKALKPTRQRRQIPSWSWVSHMGQISFSVDLYYDLLTIRAYTDSDKWISIGGHPLLQNPQAVAENAPGFLRITGKCGDMMQIDMILSASENVFASDNARVGFVLPCSKWAHRLFGIHFDCNTFRKTDLDDCMILLISKYYARFLVLKPSGSTFTRVGSMEPSEFSFWRNGTLYRAYRVRIFRITSGAKIIAHD